MRLELTANLTVSLDLSPVLPCLLQDADAQQVAEIQLQYGKSQVALGELFQVSEAEDSDRLTLVGDLTLADNLGAGMSSGELYVKGNVGNRVGQSMTGGTIHIKGNAGNQLACDLRGGVIDVQGNAGDFLGCPLPASRRGMQGGTVIVRGNVGRQAGHRMRRGVLFIEGSTGELVGFEMLAGTIIVIGSLGPHPALRMKRGSLIALAGSANDLLPSFQQDCTYRSPVIPLLAAELEKFGCDQLSNIKNSQFHLYSGDSVELSRGEILIPA
ncbi:MAG: formylmethanofuran dehydrogenase subunit C [Blastopirellula sp.]|nr:MAG: formylmethanofuran dehydrogenase subunit C [Blastopirellula sp.]